MLEKVFDFINFGPAGATDAANTVEQAQAAPTGGGGFTGLLFFLIIIILMWVLLFLPQRRQEKKHKEMLSALKKGDKIVTSSGIIGKIISITNERMPLQGFFLKAISPKQHQKKPKLKIINSSLTSTLFRGCEIVEKSKDKNTLYYNSFCFCAIRINFTFIE